MHLTLWLMLAWIAGTAAILGSLMTLGSLLLWLVPIEQTARRKTETRSPTPSKTWQHRLKLLLFSLAIAIVGFGLLGLVPFP